VNVGTLLENAAGVALGVGSVLLGLIAIDLVLTLVTVAVGAAVLRR